MRFDVVTLFPEMFEGFRTLGIIGRAAEGGAITMRFRSPREHGIGKHNNVDDTPYGGGAGMVMRVDCVVDCMEALDEEMAGAEGVGAEGGDAPRPRRILMSPQGRRLTQARVQRLAEEPALMLVCGRYEGIDHRVRAHIDEEISVGDFVLSGGELAAMVVIDAVSRCVSGVLGNPESLAEESHSPATGGQLEYPHYTRPKTFRGVDVPEVLLSGNHAKIAAWRHERAVERTKAVKEDS